MTDRFENLSYENAIGVVKAVNSYVSSNSRKITLKSHESTVMANYIIQPLMPYDAAANIFHHVLRRHTSNIGSILDYRKLSENAQNHLICFKAKKREFNDHVKGLKKIYENHLGKGAAKFGRRKSNTCPVNENQLFGTLEELQNKIFALPLTSQERERYYEFSTRIDECDNGFEKIMKKLRKSFNKEDYLTLKSGRSIQNIFIKNDVSALYYLFLLGEASKSALDTTRIPESFKGFIKNSIGLTNDITSGIVDDFMDRKKFQIPEFENIFINTAKRAREDIVKGYSNFESLFENMETYYRIQFGLRRKEDFNAVRDQINAKKRNRVKNQQKETSADVTTLPAGHEHVAHLKGDAAMMCPHLPAQEKTSISSSVKTQIS